MEKNESKKSKLTEEKNISEKNSNENKVEDNQNNENNDLHNYIDNFNNQDYNDYLLSYKKLYEDNGKCIRSKKCSSNLQIEKDKIVLKQVKKGDLEIKIPNYINIPKKLKEIQDEMKSCDTEIRYLQSIVNIDADKNVIDKYRTLRDKYFELEKEENMYNNYLEKVNNEDERLKINKELKSEISKLENIKRKLYDEIQFFHKNKNNSKEANKFNKDEYEKKIKEYLDNKKLLGLKESLKNNNLYTLKSDDLYIKVNRSKEIGEIDYLIKSINKTKKKIKIKKSTDKKN